MLNKILYVSFYQFPFTRFSALSTTITILPCFKSVALRLQDSQAHHIKQGVFEDGNLFEARPVKSLSNGGYLPVCFKRILLCTALIASVVLYPVGSYAALGETTRISNGQGDSGETSISANGRFVAFASTSKNLTAGDNNNVSDIFVHDRVTHQNTIVSVSSNGEQGNQISADAQISADGRYVAFTSAATNLVAGDTNNASDVFVHDRQTHKTTRVSVSSKGEQADHVLFASSSASYFPTISADGRFVEFESDADNLVTGDTYNNTPDIFVHDRLTRKTTRVNVSSSGEQANATEVLGLPMISANGRYVTFSSNADNLVPGDTNNATDVFVHDLQTHKTTRVSVSSSGEQTATVFFFLVSNDSVISGDGRYIVFSSTATNLEPGGNSSGLYVHDRITHQTTSLFQAPIVSNTGLDLFLRNSRIRISTNGRYVTFLAAPAFEFDGQFYVYDRITKKAYPVSVSTSGTLGDPIRPINNLGYSQGSPAISADGRYLAFDADVANLVAGDTPNNEDVFVRDRLLDTAVQANLRLAATQKPISLAVNGNGNYIFTITNNGPNTVNNVKLTHLIANGTVVSFTPSQGACQHVFISLCNLGLLLPGNSLTLQVNVKANSNPFKQQLTVSGTPIDAVPANNYLTVVTPVTP